METPELKASLNTDGEYSCPSCGASVRPHWKSCWLCNQPLIPSTTGPPAVSVASESRGGSIPGVLLMAATAFFLLFLTAGIARSDGIGTALVFLFFLTPAFVITLTKAWHRRDSEDPMSLLKITTTFIAWVFGTLLLLVGTVVAAVIALFLICLQGASMMH